MAMLNDDYSTILQNKLLKKFKNPINFILPCSIGGYIHQKAFMDLRVSINVISYSILRKLGLGILN